MPSPNEGHRRLSRRTDRQLAAESAAESDYMGYKLGSPGRERLTEVRAAAVPDDRHSPVVLGNQAFGPSLYPAQGLVGAGRVGDEASPARPVSDAA
jgi:hypothetical protein